MIHKVALTENGRIRKDAMGLQKILQIDREVLCNRQPHDAISETGLTARV